MLRRFSLITGFFLVVTTSALAAPWTLSGRVCNEVGEALLGAQVELAPMASNYDWMARTLSGRLKAEVVAATTTDAKGRFSMSVPTIGIWSLAVQAPGAVPMRYAPLPVVSDFELPQVNLPRNVGAQVELVDPHGVPEKGAFVLAVSGSEPLWKKLAQGGWRVGARFGYSDGRGEITLARAEGESLHVFVGVPGSFQLRRVEGSRQMNLVLSKAGNVERTLVVLDETGKPVADTLVGLGEAVLPVGRTNAAGRLGLVGIGRERTVLHLFSKEGGRGRYELESAGGDEILLRLGEPAQVSGKVISSEGHQSLPGTLVWPPHDPGRAVITGEGGNFEVAGFSQESWGVRFMADGFRPLAQRFHGTSARKQQIVLTPARSAYGQVLDLEEQPLAGVQIEVAAAGAASGVAPVQILTDASGRFQVEMIPAEGLDLTARKPGYAAALVRGVPIAAGKEPADLGTIWLMPALTLEGRVRDSKGRHIAQVKVWRIPSDGRKVERQREEPAAVTGANGRFQLGDLEEGAQIDLLFHGEGYLPKRLTGIEVPTARPVSVVLQPASEVRGLVVNRKGTPLPGAWIELRDSPPAAGTIGSENRRGNEAKKVVSDAEGRFAIFEVAPGMVEISSFLEEYESAPPKRLEIASGESLDGMTLVLRKGAALEGWALDENGEGVANARLTLGKREGKSDSTGYFRIAGLAPGRQVLVARHLGFKRYVKEVMVKPGENQTEVIFEGGWSVAGRVVTENGRPISGAKVSLELDRASGELRRYQATSDVEGYFEVSRMVDGIYNLEAEAAGYGLLAQKGALRVEGEPLADFEIKLALGTRVTGTIFGLEFDELAQVRVEATRGHDLRRTGVLNYEGAYEIEDLGPGVWLVRASTPGGRRQAEARVVVDGEGGEVVQDLEFYGLTLRGEVSYAGAPLPESTVSLTGQEVAVEREVITDYEGRFRLTDLPAGRYRVGVVHRQQALTHHQDIELSEDLHLPIEIATARVAGEVRATNGEEPLADALVYLEQFLDAENGSSTALTTVATNSQGTFTLARLSAGRYRLTARKDGYIPAEEVFDLEASSEKEVRLTLEPTQGLELLLRFPPGHRAIFAQISVLDPTGHLVLSDTRTIDEEGSVHFPTVPKGTWDLVVGVPGLVVSRLPVTLPGPPLELAPPVASQLELQVSSLIKENLVGEFALLSADGAPFLGLGPDGTPHRWWNLQAGVGRLGGLPEGVWTLSVLAVDGRTWQETVAIPGGQEVRVVLE